MFIKYTEEEINKFLNDNGKKLSEMAFEELNNKVKKEGQPENNRIALVNFQGELCLAMGDRIQPLIPDASFGTIADIASFVTMEFLKITASEVIKRLVKEL